MDFAAVKRTVRLPAVLRWYEVEGLKGNGDRLRGRCPIHGGGAEDAFHASLAKNVFRCFSCQSQGNVLDFVAAMERCSIREAALRLQERFGTSATTGQGRVEREATELVPKKEGGENPPLRFALSPLDARHAYLRQRGITGETAQYFGVGVYGGPGLLSGRLVIPIHDERGRLVAYCGRSVNGETPRYKLPPRFRKSLALFNLHRAAAEGGDVAVLVEGFFDCMRIHQAGFPCVVALMGAALSEAQQTLVSDRFPRLVIMLDGDEPGRAGTQAIARRLAARCSLNIVELAVGEQPDQLSDCRIRGLLRPLVAPTEMLHNAHMSQSGPRKVSAMSPG